MIDGSKRCAVGGRSHKAQMFQKDLFRESVKGSGVNGSFYKESVSKSN